MRSRDTLLRLHRFRCEEKRRQVVEIEIMITEFLKKQDELDALIRMEETRTGVSEVGHFSYSTSAKAARGRRDNLLRSIGELKDQLDTAKIALAQEESELKRLELLAEKEADQRMGQMAPVGALQAGAPAR